ncbi:MAG: transcriptional repressor [Chloroflexi bacterium]|nr:transcriptional repressor [Chloroflexota bacterium]
MNLNPSMPTPEERLRAAGQRVTAPRVLLIRLLDEAEEHLDAEELYRRARRELPSINLSTVYRNLAVLKEAGLVEQRYFARDHSREYFESAVQEEHYHFTCLSCGKVVEFETPLIAKVRVDLEAQLGVDIRHACICFEGLCAECAAAEKRTDADGVAPQKSVRIQLS